MAEATQIINFNNNSDSFDVTEKSRKVIKGLMKEAGVTSVTITDVARTTHDQARIMYKNLESKGVTSQKALYGKTGDKVIDVYVASKSAKKKEAEIIADMKKKIDGLGWKPGHVQDTSKVNVIDISPKKLQPKHKQSNFERAIKKSTDIKRYYFPPNDPAIHIEIKQ